MKKLLTFVTLFIFVLLLSATINAQSRIGKVFSKSEANVLFGKVQGSVSISLDQLREAVSNADDYIYITIKHNRPVFTNGKRKSLIRNYYVPFLSPDEPMIVFSKDAVQDFLSKVGSGVETPTSKSKIASSTSSGPTVSVERRAEVTSLTSGAYTLEMALACPPSCP